MDQEHPGLSLQCGLCFETFSDVGILKHLKANFHQLRKVKEIFVINILKHVKSLEVVP